MERRCGPFIAVVLLSLLAAFSRSSGTGPDLTAEQPFKSRTEVRQQGAVTVRAAVLTDDESERYFGVSLADHGIQVVWLSVDNASDLRLRFLPIVTDPNYFSAPEVERLLRAWWRGGANASIASIVAQAPMPDVIPQKTSLRSPQHLPHYTGLLVWQRILQCAGQPAICLWAPTGCRIAEGARHHQSTESSTAVATPYFALKVMRILAQRLRVTNKALD